MTKCEGGFADCLRPLKIRGGGIQTLLNMAVIICEPYLASDLMMKFKNILFKLTPPSSIPIIIGLL